MWGSTLHSDFCGDCEVPYNIYILWRLWGPTLHPHFCADYGVPYCIHIFVETGIPHYIHIFVATMRYHITFKFLWQLGGPTRCPHFYGDCEVPHFSTLVWGLWGDSSYNVSTFLWKLWGTTLNPHFYVDCEVQHCINMFCGDCELTGPTMYPLFCRDCEVPHWINIRQWVPYYIHFFVETTRSHIISNIASTCFVATVSWQVPQCIHFFVETVRYHTESTLDSESHITSTFLWRLRGPILYPHFCGDSELPHWIHTFVGTVSMLHQHCQWQTQRGFFGFNWNPLRYQIISFSWEFLGKCGWTDQMKPPLQMGRRLIKRDLMTKSENLKYMHILKCLCM